MSQQHSDLQRSAFKARDDRREYNVYIVTARVRRLQPPPHERGTADGRFGYPGVLSSQPEFALSRLEINSSQHGQSVA